MAASIPDDIFFASITEINQKLKAKEFSAVELTKAFCGAPGTTGATLQRTGIVAAR